MASKLTLEDYKGFIKFSKDHSMLIFAVCKDIGNKGQVISTFQGLLKDAIAQKDKNLIKKIKRMLEDDNELEQLEKYFSRSTGKGKRKKAKKQVTYGILLLRAFNMSNIHQSTYSLLRIDQQGPSILDAVFGTDSSDSDSKGPSKYSKLDRVRNNMDGEHGEESCQINGPHFYVDGIDITEKLMVARKGQVEKQLDLMTFSDRL